MRQTAQGNGEYMCNFEALDALRAQVEVFVAHARELRNNYGEVEEEFREGNLDGDALKRLNQMVHLVEKDAAEFEKLLEA